MKYVAIDEELEVPKDVSLEITPDMHVIVKGKKGEITKDLAHAKFIEISHVGKKVLFHVDFPRKNQVALVGTLKNIILNMILGVQKGYTYKMKIVYSHFPITVETPKRGSSQVLIKNFIGERAPRITHTIGDVKVTANKEEVIVSGVDKESVGQTCGNIQLKCRIKDKDKRIFQDGIYVFEKILGDETFWIIK
jgi:large subunit ribosomal protein L6